MMRLNAFAAALAFAAISMVCTDQAGAASGNEALCTVNNVNYSLSGASRVMYLGCASGNQYYIFLNSSPPTGCGRTDVDTIKMWQSLATAARLSGKVLNVWWDDAPVTGTCTATAPVTRSITALELKGN
jgi:hypothetical protein